jgi:hypothetical protein
MNTIELIECLSLQAGGVNPLTSKRKARQTLWLGLAGVLLIFLTLFQINSPDLGAVNLPMYAWRLGVLLTWDALAIVALWRLTQAALAWQVGLRHLLHPLMAMALVAAIHWAMAPRSQRAELIWGQTWQSCSVSILLLSLPLLLSLLLAMRQSCATRLAEMGATGGLVAGLTAAAVFTLHCKETSPTFVLIWYGAGIGASTALGRWLGPRCLRW